MTTRMQNRVLFWALAIVPFSGLWVVGEIYGSYWFTVSLLSYLFIYRPLLDTQRLLSLNVIEEKEVWRFFVPLAVDRFRHSKALWLG